MLAMAAPSLTSVEDALSVLASGHHVPDRDGTGFDVLTRSLITARRASELRPLDADFQVAALLLHVGPLIDPDHVDPAGLAAHSVRHLLGRRVAELVRLHAIAVTFRSMVGARSESPTEQVGAISPSQFRRFRRHRCSGDAIALAVLGEGLDPNEPSSTLLAWRPVLDAVAETTDRERELALLSLQFLAIPR